MCAKVSFTFQEALLPLLPGERRRSAQLWLESNSPCLLPVPLWSESESGGSTSRLSKEPHLFPRKWAAQAQLVCGQPVGRNAALPIYLCCCCCCCFCTSHFTALHRARFCAQLCANYSARQVSVLCTEEHSCTVCTARAARQSGAGWLRGRACTGCYRALLWAAAGRGK